MLDLKEVKQPELVIMVAITVAAGHELHHLLLGDVAGSGVKSYFGLIRYAAVLVGTLEVPLLLSARLEGRGKTISLAVLALFVIFWGGILIFLGLVFGVVDGIYLLIAARPLFQDSAYLVSPWLGVSTSLQLLTGIPLLLYGLRYAKREAKRVSNTSV